MRICRGRILPVLGVLFMVGCNAPGLSPSPTAPVLTGVPATTAPSPASPTPSASATSSPSGSPAGVESVAQFLWSSSGGDSGLSGPGSMAIDPEGRLWVADCGHSQFAIFGPDGTFVEYWEHRGTGVGEFILQRPGSGDPFGAIAYAPDGTFYVLDVGNLRVEHFDAQRHFIKAWGGFGETAGKFREPTSIVVDATGVVSVLDDKRDVVEHYDQDGQVLGSFINSAVGGANALAIDVDGNFYVSNGAGNHIEKFSPGGKLLLTIGPEGPGTTLFAGQTGPIAVDSQGRIFVGVAHSVYIFDVNGDPLDAFTIAGLAQMAPGDGFSSGMILDGSGSGYLAELTRPTDLVEKFQLLPPFSPAVTPSP